METPEKPEDIVKNHLKSRKNSKNLIAKFLKWSGKINQLSDYDDYLKDNVTVPLIGWTFKVLVVRPIPIAICLLLILKSIHPQDVFCFAEGVSLLWFLLIELKRELWRK